MSGATEAKIATRPGAPLIRSTVLLAWRVSCDDVVALTFARNRSAAKFNMLNSAREAGYYQRGRSFPSNLQAWRWPEMDNSHLREKCGRQCWNEDYARTA